MKVEEYGLLDEIKAVKEIDDEVIEKIEKIITSPNFSSGEVEVPTLEIESYRGEIVPQQLVIIKYKQLDDEYKHVNNGQVLSYYNKLDPKLLSHTVLTRDCVELLKESILFDIYLRGTILRFNKKIVESYLEYNSMLLDSLLYGTQNEYTIKDCVGEKAYSNFIKFMNKNKIAKR